MRAIDRWAIERMGVAGLELMESAGAAVAAVVEALVPDGEVVVVCGKGNNGGDGFVVARLMRERGRRVRVLCTGVAAEYSGDALTNLRRLPGEPPLVLGPGDVGAEVDLEAATVVGGAAAVVDALLGTGFAGVPRGAVAAAIELMNHAGAPVVSVDVPSGVDASSGVVSGAAVRATATVTFHIAKPGLWIAPGKVHAGIVHTVDIGIPRGALAATATQASSEDSPEGGEVGLVGATIARQLPARGPSSTKFSSGHVLVVGGSLGLTGAVRMTAEAAARAGAGYVTVAVPESLQPVLATSITPEVMVRPVPGDVGSHSEAGFEALQLATQRADAVALGTGLGRSDGAGALARALAVATERPLVLDADGLNAHAGHLEQLAQRTAPTVLTPHAGELGRMLGCPSDEIDHARLHTARLAAKHTHAVVVLKGDDTLVVDCDGNVAVGKGGSPALATAGTGDVLTGVIAALLAAGLDAFTAAATGVWLHAAAGVQAASRQGSAEGVIATDVIAALPAVRVAQGVD
jgi:NAD(P)H-hydrate epimerase